MDQTTRTLAANVLEMLDAQRRYFRTRSRDDLEASKRLEREMRTECDRIVRQPSLFDQAGQVR